LSLHPSGEAYILSSLWNPVDSSGLEEGGGLDASASDRVRDGAVSYPNVWWIGGSLKCLAPGTDRNREKG